MFFKVKRKEHMCNLAFQIYLDLYTVANLTFDPVLETRHFDKKQTFLAILHYLNRRIRSAVSKYSLLCFKQTSLIPVSDCQSELWFKRYSYFKFWANIFTLVENCMKILQYICNMDTMVLRFLSKIKVSSNFKHFLKVLPIDRQRN